MTLTLRPAGALDGPFLSEMLAVAAFWRPDGPQGSVEDAMSRPELAHYIEGWPRLGDLGVIAEHGRAVGAAWLRLLPESDPGYGFVDASTPELSIGVVQAYRGRGVGSRLLQALMATAREQGLVAISLSVEYDNRARGLYERVGFEQVDTVGGAAVMLLRL